MDLPPLEALPLTPGKAVAVLAILVIALLNVRAGRRPWYLARWEDAFGLVGLCLLLDGQYMGLVDAPRERMMGEVGRILYVHVPSAWLTMVAFTLTCLFAIGFLVTGWRSLDLLVESAAEVGVALGIVLQLTGMLFARPTWGVYWDWDPRLVSTAVMLLSFIGVLTLRSLLTDPDQRANLTSAGAILATTSMIVTYFSVRWWRSLHQMQSSPDTVASPMVLVLRINAFAMLFLFTWLLVRRWRLARALAARDEAPPLPSAEVPA
ncbi:MAG: cytochrome c biogenesis protein CcsA [Alphaproteobacteria bacterium]|nr:cytochrome c biogenesis protein CcsA [Alphaproteobacteria bacterium]